VEESQCDASEGNFTVSAPAFLTTGKETRRAARRAATSSFRALIHPVESTWMVPATATGSQVNRFEIWIGFSHWTRLLRRRAESELRRTAQNSGLNLLSVERRSPRVVPEVAILADPMAPPLWFVHAVVQCQSVAPDSTEQWIRRVVRRIRLFGISTETFYDKANQ
jgi:hypothetical protein